MELVGWCRVVDPRGTDQQLSAGSTHAGCQYNLTITEAQASVSIINVGGGGGGGLCSNMECIEAEQIFTICTSISFFFPGAGVEYIFGSVPIKTGGLYFT